MATKRSNGVETANLILSVAMREFDLHGPANFNLDRVIEQSKVSRSSLYHHFGSRDGLLLALELERLRSAMRADNLEARKLLDLISSAEEAFAIIELGVSTSASQAQRITRQGRIASFAAARHAPAIRDALRDTQIRATEEFAETLRLVKERGWIDPIEPIEGIAHFVQSFLLGRILVDILDDQEADAQWHVAAVQALRALLRPLP